MPNFGELNGAPPLTDVEYRQKVEELLKAVLGGIEEVRGLSPPEEVSLRIISAEWARENWGRRYVEANLEKIKVEENIYKALFLLPEDAGLAEVLVEWSGDYAAGVIENDIFVVRENFDPKGAWAERTLAHEVTHIIQGEHFEILEKEKHDEKQAWAALIEGDAELTAGKYMERIESLPASETAVLLPAGFLASASASNSGDLPFMRILRFPYDYGEDFVETLFERGGWELVNKAYSSPPVTTEQVMHPEKYFSKEPPVEVDGSSPPLPPEWKQKRSDRFGEHFILVVLGTWIPLEDAAEAAEGWGGDRFTYYEKGERYLFVWEISWDSEEDAAEFHDAWSRMMKTLDSEEIREDLWAVQQRYFQLTTEGSTTLILSSDDLSALEPSKSSGILSVWLVVGVTFILATALAWWVKRKSKARVSQAFPLT